MPTPQRLPIVNADDAVWGDILRQYLMKEHYNDDTDNAVNGSHRNVTIRPGTASAGSAPLKFTAGTLLSIPEPGAIEFTTNELFFTTTSGTVRKKFAVYDDSSGAQGDLYYRNNTGEFVRLPIGSAGTILKVSSGLPSWQDGRIGSTVTIAASTDLYMDGTESVILGSDSSYAELPPAASFPGYQFVFKKISGTSLPANSFYIEANIAAGDTIDGGTGTDIVVLNTSITVVSNGDNWYII